jgi:hypothetical protein
MVNSEHYSFFQANHPATFREIPRYPSILPSILLLHFITDGLPTNRPERCDSDRKRADSVPVSDMMIP